jgi:hypothetical protein
MTYSTAQQMADIHARSERTEEQKLYVWEMSKHGHTRGMAERDGDQIRARKNPDPILGETYLLWSEQAVDASPTFVATYCGEHDGERLFATFAYVLQPGNDEAALDFRTTTSQHTIEDKVWVKARFATVPLTEAQLETTTERMQELRRELSAEQAWFSEFSDAMNELAEGHGWCGTYDDIVRDIGMPGREKDYWVEVSANCTITDTSPSSRLDSLLEGHYGGTIETTSVSFSGKVIVRVDSVTATSDSEAQSRVDRDSVLSVLNDMFSGDVELDDWEVKDSGEED